jgi:CheY-like chemotaxis protein
VLVVEDSPLECELLVRALAARGHEVMTASDVVGAWELLQSERIALALIDLHLGLSDGRELLERIRGLESADQPHCVVITASSDPQHVRDALAGGAHDFIRKELLHSDLDVRLAVAEQQAETRARQLRTEALQKALYRISEATHSAQSLDRLCERIYRVLSEVMETPNFYIALLDRGSRVVSFPFWRDERESAPSPRIGGTGLTEHVLRTGEPLLVDRAGQEQLAALGTVAIASEPPDYWLGVPLCPPQTEPPSRGPGQNARTRVTLVALRGSSPITRVASLDQTSRSTYIFRLSPTYIFQWTSA